jgi:hypothetical protein
MVELPKEWVKEYQDDGTCRFYKVSKCNDDNVLPVVSHCVLIKEDFTWSAHVRNRCIYPENFSSELSSVLITKLISEVDKYHLCIGNPDTKFVEMLKSYKAKQILDRSRSIVVAFLDQKGILHNGTYYHSTVRAVSCPIVTKAENPKCIYCTDYRRNLRSLYSRYEKKSCSSQTSTSTYTNIRFLTTPERRQTISKTEKSNFGTQKTDRYFAA